MSQADRGATGRDPWLDNVRAVLIVLVVVGHSLEQVDTWLGDRLYTFIYSFHMPAFVLVSGYLSRSWRASHGQVVGLVTTLAVPYVIFQLIGALQAWWLGGGEFDLAPLTPGWTLWFLIALFAWRLAVPVFRVLRHPVAIAVLVALLAPFDDALDQTGSIARVMSFLPFFVIGLVLTPQRLDLLRRGALRWVGMAMLAIALAGALIGPEVSRSTFYLSSSYSDRGDHTLFGVLVRIAILVWGTLAAFAVIAASPRRRHWFSIVGVNSLVVYLLHAALLNFWRLTADGEPDVGTWGTLLLVAAAIVGALMLGSPVVERATRWLVRPPVATLLTRQEQKSVST